jgi:hypothetical protein
LGDPHLDDPTVDEKRTVSIDSFTLSVGGLVARPGVYDLGQRLAPARRRARRIALIDLFALVRLDRAAEVLEVACALGGTIAVPLRDVIARNANLELTPSGVRLVVPGWCERDDGVIAVRLTAVTFGEFLRIPPDERPSDREGLM